MGFKRLDLSDRKQIEVCIKEKWSFSRIGRQIGRSVSCVIREVQINSVDNVYDAEEAQKISWARSSECQHNDRKSHERFLTEEQKKGIEDLFNEGNSLVSIRKKIKISHYKLYGYVSYLRDKKLLNKDPTVDRIAALEMQVQILSDMFKDFLKRDNAQ